MTRSEEWAEGLVYSQARYLVLNIIGLSIAGVVYYVKPDYFSIVLKWPQPILLINLWPMFLLVIVWNIVVSTKYSFTDEEKKVIRAYYQNLNLILLRMLIGNPVMNFIIATNEEMLFRFNVLMLFFFPTISFFLNPGASLLAALMLSNLFFTLDHFDHNPKDKGLSFPFILGLVLTYIVARHGIFQAILVHAMCNIVSFWTVNIVSWVRFGRQTQSITLRFE